MKTYMDGDLSNLRTREQLNTMFPPPKSIRITLYILCRMFLMIVWPGMGSRMWVDGRRSEWQSWWLWEKSSTKLPPPTLPGIQSCTHNAIPSLSFQKNFTLQKERFTKTLQHNESQASPHTMPFSLLQDLLYVKEKFEMFLAECIAYITCRSIAVWVTGVKQQQLSGFKEFYRLPNRP